MLEHKLAIALGLVAFLLVGPVVVAKENSVPLVETRETGFFSGAWQVENGWDEDAELEYSAFVQALGEAREKKGFRLIDGLSDPLVNPLYTDGDDKALEGLEVDCANLPYVIRAYFAYKTNRPFSFQANKEKRYREGNLPREFSDFSRYEDFRGLIQGVISAVSSGHFRVRADVEGTDTYPIDIDAESLRPGSVFYDPNGHVLQVYKVDHDKGDIFLLDGHPDGTMSRKIFGTSYARGSARFGGGFNNWRHYHVKLLDAKSGSFTISREKNSQARSFSDTAQYKLEYWVDGYDMTYHEWVRAKVSANGLFIEPVDAFDKMLGALCGDFQDRVHAVDAAVEAGMHLKEHPSELPWNIYGASGDWERFSSPGRDARLRFKVAELRGFIMKTMVWATRGDKRLKYGGSVVDLATDYFRIWYEHYGSKECIIQYRNSVGADVTLSLEDVLERIWSLSFDPYHCPELRWGAPMVAVKGQAANEIATCPDDKRKLRWYEKQQRLRNRTTRLLRKATAVHRGPSSPENVDIPSLLNCYADAEQNLTSCHKPGKKVSQNQR